MYIPGCCNEITTSGWPLAFNPYIDGLVKPVTDGAPNADGLPAIPISLLVVGAPVLSADVIESLPSAPVFEPDITATAVLNMLVTPPPTNEPDTVN